MSILRGDAETIYSAPKKLLGPFQWNIVDEKSTRNARTSFKCRVEIGSAIRRGVFFRISIFSGAGFRAMFQLEVDSPNGRTHTPLYRLDVNPHAPHPNALFGPEEINGLFIPAGQTHEHDFHDSLTSSGELRARADEQARPVTLAREDFVSVLGYVCSKINIVNCNDLPEPEAQGLLL
jgi:hypothetical protein